MSGPLPAETPADRLLAYVTEGRTEDAYRAVDEALEAGWGIEQLVTELLAPVQRSLGEQWQAGRRTVSQEHAGTAVIDDLLGALGRRLPPARRQETIALVCAEGEWHVTPARMAALRFRAAGWRTVFLGGSTPLGHLERTLALNRPTFLAISCTDPRFLLGAAGVAAVAARLVIPSVAGGAALGADDTRARRLGIDGWAADPAAASMLLRAWLDDPPPATSWGRADEVEPAMLARRWADISEQTIQRLSSMAPAVLPYGAQPLDAIRRDLLDLLQMDRIGAICGDPALLETFVAWLTELHPPRGLPHAAIPTAVRILQELAGPRPEGATETPSGRH